MSKTASWLNGRFEYRPLSQNSNTFIGHILRHENLQRDLSTPQYWPNKTNERIDSDDYSEILENTMPQKLNIPGANSTPRHGYDDDEIPFIGPEHFNSRHQKPKNFPMPKPEESKNGETAPDVFEKYDQVMSNKDKHTEEKPSDVMTPKTKEDVSPLLQSSTPVPDKGPERVDQDPSYNPFNRDKNGFEDLEGEVHVWKKDPLKKDQLIREAGREKDFGLDIDYDTDGRPLPKKGPFISRSTYPYSLRSVRVDLAAHS